MKYNNEGRLRKTESGSLVLPKAIGIIETRKGTLVAKHVLNDFFTFNDEKSARFGRPMYTSQMYKTSLDLNAQLKNDELDLEYFYDSELVEQIKETIKDTLRKINKEEESEKESPLASAIREFFEEMEKEAPCNCGGCRPEGGTKLFDETTFYHDPNFDVKGIIIEGTVLPQHVVDNWALFTSEDAMNQYFKHYSK